MDEKADPIYVLDLDIATRLEDCKAYVKKRDSSKESTKRITHSALKNQIIELISLGITKATDGNALTVISYDDMCRNPIFHRRPLPLDYLHALAEICKASKYIPALLKNAMLLDESGAVFRTSSSAKVLSGIDRYDEAKLASFVLVFKMPFTTATL